MNRENRIRFTKGCRRAAFLFCCVIGAVCRGGTDEM